jgi:hypothetical protein
VSWNDLIGKGFRFIVYPLTRVTDEAKVYVLLRVADTECDKGPCSRVRTVVPASAGVVDLCSGCGYHGRLVVSTETHDRGATHELVCGR